ncbi:hypothetical protein CPB86DRAFT_396079 [Serendipita vermifera]|nr:hypothetical protein CPB86DRAFT_396079 [Serendipita vermifera]
MCPSNSMLTPHSIKHISLVLLISRVWWHVTGMVTEEPRNKGRGEGSTGCHFLSEATNAITTSQRCSCIYAFYSAFQLAK